MFEQLFEGVFLLVVRLWSVWTMPVFHWVTHRLFHWLKDFSIPRLSYKSASLNQCVKKTDKSCHHSSWNPCLLANCVSSRKQFSPWIPKSLKCVPQEMALILHLTGQNQQICSPFSTLSGLAKATFSDNFIKSTSNTSFPHFTGMCENLENYSHTFSAASQDSNPWSKSYQTAPHTGMENFVIGRCQNAMEFSDQFTKRFPLTDSMGSLYCPEKQYSSAASIDSGYRSFHSIESGCKCIEEDGVTLFVTDCCFNKDGKLIRMSIGFDVFDESLSSESCFEDETDEFVANCDDEATDDEEFIVFDSNSWCCKSSDNESGSSSLCGISIAVSSTMESFPIWDRNINGRPSCSVQPSHKYNSLPNSPKVQDPRFTYKTEPDLTVEINFTDCSDNFSKIPDEFDRVNHGKEEDGAGTVTSSKKRVHFKEDLEVHNLVKWAYAYQTARKGEWQKYAADREHFKQRIQEVEKTLNPMLLHKIAMTQTTTCVT